MLIVERPTLHLCYSNSFLHFWPLPSCPWFFTRYWLWHKCEVQIHFFGRQAARVQGPSRCKLAWVPLLHWNEKWWKKAASDGDEDDNSWDPTSRNSVFKTCWYSYCFGQFGDLQISNKGNTHVWAYPIHVPRHYTQFYHNFRGHHVSHIPQKNQNFFSSFLPLRILTIKCIGFQFSGARHQYVGTLSCSWLLLAYWLTYICVSKMWQNYHHNHRSI